MVDARQKKAHFTGSPNFHTLKIIIKLVTTVTVLDITINFAENGSLILYKLIIVCIEHGEWTCEFLESTNYFPWKWIILFFFIHKWWWPKWNFFLKISLNFEDGNNLMKLARATESVIFIWLIFFMGKIAEQTVEAHWTW